MSDDHDDLNLDDLDVNGYPTETTLDEIRSWRPDKSFDYAPLFERLRGLWCYPTYFSSYESSDGRFAVYVISTCGWSGNEDLIGALQDNFIAWSLCWYSSQRGGHYEFHVPHAAPKNV